MSERSKIISFEDACIRRVTYLTPDLPKEIRQITKCKSEVDGFFAALERDEEAKTRYAKTFRRKLRILEKYWKECEDAEGFEQLKHLDVPLYSFHVPGKEFNLRILFVFFTINGYEQVVLLHVFDEKEKDGPKSYKHGVGVARKRYAELCVGSITIS